MKLKERIWWECEIVSGAKKGKNNHLAYKLMQLNCIAAKLMIFLFQIQIYPQQSWILAISESNWPCEEKTWVNCLFAYCDVSSW